jgi:hypothetical protein
MHIEEYLVSNVVNPQVYTSLHFTALQLHFTSPTIITLQEISLVIISVRG